ncbi:hypothetical protein GQ457_03G011960 [Hibiscus cannabinus]
MQTRVLKPDMTHLVDGGLLPYRDQMRDFGVEPNSEHHACMVDLLSCGGDLNEAYRTIGPMPSPTDACKHLETIEDDTGYYTLLSNIYAEEGN